MDLLLEPVLTIKCYIQKACEKLDKLEKSEMGCAQFQLLNGNHRCSVERLFHAVLVFQTLYQYFGAGFCNVTMALSDISLLFMASLYSTLFYFVVSFPSFTAFTCMMCNIFLGISP